MQTSRDEPAALGRDVDEPDVRLAKAGLGFHNFREPLLRCRRNSGGISHRMLEQQVEQAYTVFTHHYSADATFEEYLALIDFRGTLPPARHVVLLRQLGLAWPHVAARVMRAVVREGRRR